MLSTKNLNDGVKNFDDEEEITIFEAPRDISFTNFLRNLLKKGKLKEKYINILLDKDSLKEYSNAFTSDTADELNNYEIYEQLGDLAINKFIVHYMYNRFPILKKSAKYVKIVARLRINYGSKQTFFDIAQNLGFWNFITASDQERSTKMKSLCEDTFESFIGVTESLLDSKIRNGVGYAIVYDILSSIFDDIYISLKYEDLFDNKTRLKELFDHFGKDAVGTLEYVDTKDMTTKISTSIIYQNLGFSKIQLGQGSAALKADAQQRAAQNALAKLKNMGYVKPVDEIYKEINQNII